MTEKAARKLAYQYELSTSRSRPAWYRLIRSIKWRQGNQANHFFVITFYCVVRYYSKTVSKKIERNVFETSAISMTQKFKPNLPLFVTRNFENLASKTSPVTEKAARKLVYQYELSITRSPPTFLSYFKLLREKL